MNERQTQRYLDQVEDAEREVAEYLRFRRWVITAVLGGFGVLLAGVAVGIGSSIVDVPLGLLTAALVVGGLVLTPIATVFLFCWIEDTKDPRPALVNAQRAYRDNVLAGGES